MNLTGLSIVLLALICLIGVTEQWSGATGMTLWRVAAALLVLGLGYEWLRIRAAHVSVSGEGTFRLRLGKQGNLRLRFDNADPRDCLVEFVPGLPAVLGATNEPNVVRVPAGGHSECQVTARAAEPGTLAWSGLPARIKGPLGLGWWRYPLPLASRIEVVPDLLGTRRNVIGQFPTGERSSGVGSGPELHHLREYVAGDPRHTVDWKATARTQQLITRVFSEEQHLEIMLVLDVGRTSRTEIDGLSQFAHYVNLGAKFAQHAASCGDHIGLIAAADKPLVLIPPQRGDMAVVRVRRAMQRLHAMPVETDLLAAALLVQEVARQRCLVILLTDLYGQSISGDFGRALEVWNVRHLPMVVGLIGEDVRAVPEQPAQNRTDPYVSLAAREYRNSLLGNAAGARRLGALTVVARPAELQSRIFSEYQTLKQQRRV